MHEKPAAHAVHDPTVVVQPLDVAVVEAYPAVQVHVTRAAEPPAHDLPTPHVVHDALVPVHVVMTPDAE